MKNILFTLCFLFSASVIFAQIKVVATGDVGIGTSTPGHKLEVNGGNLSVNGGDLLLTGVSGTSRIKGTDPAKRVEVLNFNNTTVSKSYFTLFGDHATRSGEMTFAGTYLRFFSNVQNGTFGSEAARITAAGDMGIGISAPAEKLHVGGNILATGTITSSDRNLKTNIKKYSRGLSDLMNIDPVTYNYNGKAGITSKRTHVGIIAQEINEVAPELVGKYEYIEEDIDRKSVSTPEDYYYVDEKGIIYMLVNAVKEQQEIIEEKNTEIIDNRQRIAELEAKLNTIIEAIDDQLVITEVTLSSYDLAELSQNIPNPFNGRTAINYIIPTNANSSKLVLFDQSGKLIKTVDISHTGKGQINLNANDLPSGIYSYQLIVDGKTIDSKKMSLQK